VEPVALIYLAIAVVVLTVGLVALVVLASNKLSNNVVRILSVLLGREPENEAADEATPVGRRFWRRSGGA
jgi:hypothetical protein